MPHRWNMDEHRWGERIRVNIPVVVSAPAAAAAAAGFDGCMKNLSLSGALMQAAADLNVRTVVRVSILLPTPSAGYAVVEARVSRKVRENIGLEWCEFAPNVVKELLRSAEVRSSA